MTLQPRWDPTSGFRTHFSGVRSIWVIVRVMSTGDHQTQAKQPLATINRLCSTSKTAVPYHGRMPSLRGRYIGYTLQRAPSRTPLHPPVFSSCGALYRHTTFPTVFGYQESLMQPDHRLSRDIFYLDCLLRHWEDAFLSSDNHGLFTILLKIQSRAPVCT